MKLAVVGTRAFKDYILLKNELDKITDITLIITGGCRGADTLAELYAKDHNIPTQIFEADWNRYGRAAGPIRNRLIIRECDKCVAFWDGQSRGTFNDINLCKEYNKPITIIQF